MTDCPNADVRDLLPDLLHGQLASDARAMVEAHLQSCADCRAEFQLLRDLASTMRRVPRLNGAAITAAVPAYRPAARRSWVGWRTAAAITLMVAGGSSVVVLRRDVSPVADSVMLPAAVAEVSVPAIIAPTVLPKRAVPAAVDAQTSASTMPQLGVSADGDRVSSNRVRELTLATGPLTELSERELARLLTEIQSLDAVPTADVESSAISPIAPARSRL